MNQDIVKYELGDKVDKMPSSGCLRADEARPQGVKQYLEGGKESLSKNVVKTKKLKVGWKVHVYTIFAEMFVMLKVVSLE